MIKAYKFKIKRPSKTVVQRFEQTLDLCRELYNAGLQERRDAWQMNQISIDYFDQQKQIPEIKIIRKDLETVYSQVLQDVLRNLDRSFKSFFRRVKESKKAGFPRFKSANRFNSFCYTQQGFKLDGDKLSLSKIGLMRIRLSREIIGKVKTCTIKREISGWFVIFTVETIADLLPKSGKQIGLDVGIESFATLSDGTHIENHKYYESTQRRLRIAQRRISRRQKGSSRRLKAIELLRRVHLKIRSQRSDFTHKLSTQLVKKYDLIAIEKLNILGMAKGILSKQIHDAAWGSFFAMLRYKAENAGKQIIEVSPNYTSQTCLCGERKKKTLSERQHTCLKCGYSNHRDIVSAQIILLLGQRNLNLTKTIGL